MRFVERDIPPRAVHGLEQAGVHPLLARLLAARGLSEAAGVDPELSTLLPPAGLRGCADAAALLADAIGRGERLCVVADYDCDGATACAVALRGLALFGADVGYLVPNRFTTGYGLSPAVADLVAARRPRPHWIITVDNGIASVEGVARARELGMKVLVTDHHLPGAELPAAEVIVNPNQAGCDFASKSLAGVGVMFYVLLALRAELRRRGAFGGPTGSQPRLDSLLDLVALGTVADVVRLDANNRLLVAHGLRRMREGRLQPGLGALFAAAARDPRQASSFDLGFALGPRINAAGRLADMTVGIELLLTDDVARAQELAQTLDAINRQRRGIEGEMREQAAAALAVCGDTGAGMASICLYDPTWHEGVVGIVAGRLKEAHHRPAFVFAPGGDGSLRGSGRSIPGLHLRDALDLVAKREPGLLLRFGGHAAAAGCSIGAAEFARFAAAFDAVAREQLSPDLLARRLEVDGELPGRWFDPEVAALLQSRVWGQGFAAPVFASRIEVVQQAQLGSSHLRARVRVDGEAGTRELIAWNRSDFLPARARVAWRLEANNWQGRSSARMVLEAVEDPA